MLKNRNFFLIFVSCLIAISLGSGYQTVGTAQIPPIRNESVQPGASIPYEALLTDISGNPVSDGLYDFSFALYDSEFSKIPVWLEVQEEIPVNGGRVFTSFGNKNPIPVNLHMQGSALWVEIGIRGPGETDFTYLLPRQLLNTSYNPIDLNQQAEGICAHDHFGEQWIGTGSNGLFIGTDNHVGVQASSDNYIGVMGISTPYLFVYPSTGKYGLYGYSYSDNGIYGITNGEWGWISGVFGEASKANSNGVTGWNSGDGVGVYGYSENGYSGYFSSDVFVSGYLTKAGGGFKIDHPLDPANKYLNHSFVESPEMKNLYDGVVTLDVEGASWVDLPEWFEALNHEFRYQLTPIGSPAPDIYIAQEIKNNRFLIAGGEPGLKVSWQVTGTRKDAFAEAHPIQVEEEKEPADIGTYLHPEEYGMPTSLGMEYQRNQTPE